jgi:hypothetical protein
MDNTKDGVGVSPSRRKDILILAFVFFDDGSGLRVEQHYFEPLLAGDFTPPTLCLRGWIIDRVFENIGTLQEKNL